MADDQWIFGYGSLVWRPSFEFLEREPGFILGYRRRFWQASPDHRGTPAAPGRVVTLIEGGADPCWGVGYRVAAETWPAVLEELDYREKEGYQRRTTTLYFRDRADPATALVYIAAPGNPCFQGESPLEAIAEVVRTARGPSGANRDYVLELHAALVDMGGRDEHVAALAALLEEG